MFNPKLMLLVVVLSLTAVLISASRAKKHPKMSKTEQGRERYEGCLHRAARNFILNELKGPIGPIDPMIGVRARQDATRFCKSPEVQGIYKRLGVEYK